MLAFFVVVAAFYGLVIGSFLNALVYRVPRKESLNTRSHCPQCNAQINWYQNIPVVSYCALRGKCASCGLPISLRYPAVELAGAASFAWVTAWFGSRLDLSTTVTVLVIVGLLWLLAAGIALSLIDFELQLLPTVIIYPTLAVLLVTLGGASILEADYAQLLRALLGMGALGLFYGLIWFAKPGAMGFGDVRLSLVLGFTLAWFSWGLLIFGTFAAFGLASIFGVVLMVRSNARGKTALPFGPWMILGTWISLFVGAPIIQVYLSFSGL